MPRKLNPSPDSNTLVSAFLLLSFGLSVALLRVRNLYDDEITSLHIITSPVTYILRLIAVTDAHPPGMYLLGHFAYRMIPSFRWMNLVSAMFLYAGLAVFLFQVTPRLTSSRSRIVLLVLATLHPQLLMWGVTYRWYGWWTGLALVTVTIALQPSRIRPNLGAMRSAMVGLLLAALFYINFITLLFAVALAGAMLLRYRPQRAERVTRALMISAIFLILAAPQFPAMITVHIPNGASQRSGIINSSLHLLQSIAASEAYLPWHALAIAADLLFVTLCTCGLVALAHRILTMRTGADPDYLALDGPLAPIVVFGLLFLFLVAVSGLGGKPRNGLLLIPVLAVVVGVIASTLRPRLQIAVLVFFAVWIAIGFAHMEGRYGLDKATMIGRPEELAAYLRQTSGADCSVVVTYDAPLAFTLNQAKLPHTMVISPFREVLLGSAQFLPGSDCTHLHLYVVESYANVDDEETQEIQSATHFFDGPLRKDSFSFDPDAQRKRGLARIPLLGRDLASAATLPDYRYVVTSGLTDLSRLYAMRQSMPAYISGQQFDDQDSPLTP